MLDRSPGAAQHSATTDDDSTTTAPAPEHRRGRRARALTASPVTLGGVGAATALVPRLMSAGAYPGPDEWLWLVRSVRFSDALQGGDFAAMSSSAGRTATMPGVTTMWIGTLARAAWRAGGRVGLVGSGDAGAGFSGSASGLTVAHATAAVASSILVGVVVVLLALWAGRLAAIAAAGLLVTEPLLVTHGAAFHTDSLVAMFGIASLLAAALALGVPRRTAAAGSRRLSAMSGALCALAVLTKLSALAFLPSLAIIAGWALLPRWRQAAGATGALRRPAALLAAWVAGAVATLPLYPALWAAPATELGRLVDSAAMAGRGHPQFFLGEVTDHPGPLFYLVVVPFRLTPWFLVAAILAGVGLWVSSATRGHAAALTAMALPTFVVISLASKQMERYAVPLVPIAAVGVGVAASRLAGWWVDRAGGSARRRATVVAAGGGTLGVLLFTHAVALAPWSSAYYNPVLGGGERAQRVMLVGRGEGTREAGALIAGHAAGRCDQVTISAVPAPGAYPCGRFHHGRGADYRVILLRDRQRTSVGRIAQTTRGRPLVGTVTIRGVTYVEVYGPEGSPAAEPTHLVLQ